MVAVTTTLRFTPFVLKLPVRPPVLVAKQAASVAALTNNRLALGVGISPWPEDFAIIGVPLAKRGKRMDECMDIVRGLTAGGFFEFHGEFYDIPAIKKCPAPTEPIPLLVGGHADRALRRAVLNGDGWMHAGGARRSSTGCWPGSPRSARRRGSRRLRDPRDLARRLHLDGIKRLEDKGVTD